jgi:hypothetical protein
VAPASTGKTRKARACLVSAYSGAEVLGARDERKRAATAASPSCAASASAVAADCSSSDAITRHREGRMYESAKGADLQS